MAKQAHQRYKRVARDAPPPSPPPKVPHFLAPEGLVQIPKWERPVKEPKEAPEPDTAAAEVSEPTLSAYFEARQRAGNPTPPPELEPGDQPVPADWVKGQLLNVRCTGGDYRVTLLGEEYDDRHPERCLLFTNSFECQQFVSRWYAREPGGRPW